ncbi:TRAPP II complex [Fimicolochytrium jonesii]|uniref:TRAPP II complex n=1 Tax=Fimicolochytrium jonesii TaxID=1396493 RepID=UPI0022FE53A4|nr:TRAPP II complex [Fimicolochytrium jonesii]KAI8820488.1 TRAPP II complex [Fimicolochytrium jonesii]
MPPDTQRGSVTATEAIAVVNQVPVDILKPARVRVLLAPVGPFRKNTFQKYVDIISQFSVILTADLTKPDLTKTPSKYAEQMYEREGYIHMNYVTSYDKEHGPLEEMQVWRQVVAVIGIMHCQEVQSIGDGVKRFQTILTRYPGVLASRCFAFEPADQQADDTRGCIMIPDDPKKLSFYLMTQINDLANELLVSFGNMAAHAEKRPMINGPIMAMPALSPGALSISSPMSVGGTSSPFTPSGLISGQASSASLTSPVAGSGSMNRDPSISSLATQDSSASMLGSLFTADKTKKRTPARAQKIVGDLFLLAGALDQAIASFTSALEAMKASGDYQWQASALESYYCALTLSLLPKTGAWVIMFWQIRTTSYFAKPTDPSEGQQEEGAFSRQPLGPPTYNVIFEGARSHPQFRMLICDIPERYREIASLYEKAYQPGLSGYYPYLHISAYLTMSKFLATMWLTRFNGPVTNGAGIALYAPESKGIADLASNIGITSAGGRTGGASGGGPAGAAVGGQTSDKERIILHGGLGCSRADVSSWAMKAWASGVENSSSADQLRCATSITTAYALIGYWRKHAFFLRQTSLLLAAHYKDGSRRVGRNSSLPNISEDLEDRPARVPDTAGLMECLRCVCAAYASEDSNLNKPVKSEALDYIIDTIDDDTEDWADEFFNEDDLDTENGEPALMRQPLPISRVRGGWSDLSIDAFLELIDIAKSLDEHKFVIRYSLRLLQRFWKYIDEYEQSDILRILEDEAKLHPVKAQSLSESCRIPVVRRIEVVRQVPTQVPYPHARSLLRGVAAAQDADAKDPFLYNPFADKGKLNKKDLGRSVVLVAGEAAHFDITLANPFAFELEIEDLTILTSNLDFKATPNYPFFIPSSCRSFSVRLSGVPLEAGTLYVRGIRAKLFGGVEVEVDCISKLLEDTRLRTKDGRRRRQDEKSRFGKRADAGKQSHRRIVRLLNLVSFCRVKPSDWFFPIKVIPPQASLRFIKDASMPMSRMLFEGERTMFPIRLENIGKTTIDFLSVGLIESYAPQGEKLLSPDGQEDPEEVYERDVHRRNIRALWVERNGVAVGRAHGDAVAERIAVNIAPGEEIEIMIGLFGKTECVGGTITVSYATVGEDPTAEPPASETFYTRTLVQPIIFTVVESLHPINMDMMLLTNRDGFVSGEQQVERNLSLEEMTVDIIDVQEGGGAFQAGVQRSEEYFVVALDLKNFWRGVFEVGFEVYDGDIDGVPSYESRTMVHAGTTKRIHLPMKRLRLPNSITQEPIPQPEWKQFVVGKTRKRAAAEERERRMWFWYREEILKRVRVLWTASGRRGAVDLRRALTLTKELGRVVRKCPISVAVVVEGRTTDANGLCKVSLWETVVVRWTVHNRLGKFWISTYNSALCLPSL